MKAWGAPACHFVVPRSEFFMRTLAHLQLFPEGTILRLTQQCCCHMGTFRTARPWGSVCSLTKSPGDYRAH
jgi:hypothetical protein